MTREEIEELKGLAASMGLYDDKNPCKRAVILGKAIKALEQEPILDRVRAEIDKSRFIDKDTRIAKNALASGLEVAMQIIDKYKGESEENNAV